MACCHRDLGFLTTPVRPPEHAKIGFPLFNLPNLQWYATTALGGRRTSVRTSSSIVILKSTHWRQHGTFTVHGGRDAILAISRTIRRYFSQEIVVFICSVAASLMGRASMFPEFLCSPCVLRAMHSTLGNEYWKNSVSPSGSLRCIWKTSQRIYTAEVW